MSGQQMDLIGLITDGLRRHGFDGLFNTDGECACKIGELVPCDELSESCEPGVFIDEPCSNCGGGESCDFHIGRKK